MVNKPILPTTRKGRKTVKFGTRLRQLRYGKNIGQTELSTETGLSQGHISKIESDEAKPTREVLRRLAHFFGEALEVLVQGTDAEDVLVQPEFAQRYGYCPNIECPATSYVFWSDDAGQEVTYTVDELWKRYGDQNYGRHDRETWDAPDPDLSPRELLTARSDATVRFRWTMLDEKTKFCEFCGTHLRSTCRFCDTPLKLRNQKYCHACGQRLDRPPAVSETARKAEN